jgi:hypothetical protein
MVQATRENDIHMGHDTWFIVTNSLPQRDIDANIVEHKGKQNRAGKHGASNKNEHSQSHKALHDIEHGKP